MDWLSAFLSRVEIDGREHLDCSATAGDNAARCGERFSAFVEQK